MAEKVGAPLAPGTLNPVADAEEVLDFVDVHGLPVAIKAAFGGGGRGLKVARTREEIPELFESATREAIAAFGRGECFVEKYLDQPRHVETQCLADAAGNVVVVSTRDCSLQRRHQKLVEEAPAPFLTEEQTTLLYESSKAILREVGYLGAGTCEFLIGKDGTVSFLEVNTRLQVEHPVSEEVTGIDLVREQFRIAEGGLLDYDDPVTDGSLDRVPHQRRRPGPRLPADARAGARAALPRRSRRARRLRRDHGRRHLGRLRLAAREAHRDRHRPARTRSRRPAARSTSSRSPACRPCCPSTARSCATRPSRPGRQPFGVYTRWIETEFDNDLEPWGGMLPDARAPERARGGRRGRRQADRGLACRTSCCRREPPRHPPAPPAAAAAAPVVTATGNAVKAPMQATVVKVAVEEGEKVVKGDLMLVLEAMKMEQPLTAHKDGTVGPIHATVGATVSAATCSSPSPTRRPPDPGRSTGADTSGWADVARAAAI